MTGTCACRSPRWATVALLLLGASYAQPPEGAWTVQTVALRDFRDAQATADNLRELGFPSYTEFAMNRGAQWVRVRVGCWLARDGAEAVAEILRGFVTAEAATVPLTPDAPVDCVEVDVGFIKPARYLALHLSGELPTFEVEVADHVAYVRHDAERWTVWQGGAEPAPELAPEGAATFRAGEIRGFAVVLAVADGVATVFCPGRFLAQAGDVAVVEWANAVVACSGRPRPEARTW